MRAMVRIPSKESDRTPFLLLAGIAVAAIVAGLAGLAVGIPSLRLRGDYLAIVTLGFWRKSFVF
jgi:branched-chain amino acid transport system permease protein